MPIKSSMQEVFDQLKSNGEAAVKNSELANHRIIRQRYPVLSQAILFGASGQIRNMATVGGNLLQRRGVIIFTTKRRAVINAKLIRVVTPLPVSIGFMPF
ncbi:FAD binding domain-containing protein [Methylobacter sp.]|uniref:FAD binding domain-containing protein n=1 Tax=Methylobacter sp. TaxID=2051955 RepID=UPI002FDF029F